ncbi:MAG: PepSY domain-containing protein [Hyphomicrobium sp.]
MASLALLLGGVPSTASARRGRGHDDEGEHHEDYDRARAAVGSGEAIPLSEIVVEVKKVIDGDVLDVELQKTESGLVYQIRMLSRTGTYHRVRVDAKTKIILRIEQQ